MTGFALSAPLEHEDRLAVEARRHGHDVVARAATADELAARLASAGAAVVLVGAGEPHCSAVLVEACDRAGVRLVALAADDAERRHAQASGAGVVLPADAAWSEIERAIAVEVAPAPAAAGRVLVVWGPAGSPGRTTLAISLAAELAGTGARVALADVDVHAASVAASLGLLDEAPGFAAACRLARTGGLTTLELDRIAQRVTTPYGQFRVLTGLARAGRWPEVAPDRVAAVLAVCREWVDWTIVDVGASLESDEEISSDRHAPRRNGATLAALSAADEVLAVGVGDPVGLTRFLRAHGELVEHLGHTRIRVVMNKTRASAMGLAPESHVEQTLRRFGGITDVEFVPFDAKPFDAALLQGATVAEVAGRSHARRAIVQLARTIAPPAPGETRRAIREASPRGRRRLLRRVRALH